MDRVRAMPDLAGLNQSYVTKPPFKRKCVESLKLSQSPTLSHKDRHETNVLGSPFHEVDRTFSFGWYSYQLYPT